MNTSWKQKEHSTTYTHNPLLQKRKTQQLLKCVVFLSLGPLSQIHIICQDYVLRKIGRSVSVPPLGLPPADLQDSGSDYWDSGTYFEEEWSGKKRRKSSLSAQSKLCYNSSYCKKKKTNILGTPESLQILKAYLTKCRFVVQSRAPVAMTARTNLEVEGTVYPVWMWWCVLNRKCTLMVSTSHLLVLFCAEDGGQILGHLGSSILRTRSIIALLCTQAPTHFPRSVGVYYLEFNVTSN